MKFNLFALATLVVAAAIVVAGCKPQIEPKEPQLPPQPPRQPENITAECTSDSDCSVGGCSGQVCTTTGEAKGLITTCEYREEYGCLKLTSCGCAGGKCAWKETPELKSCLDAAKS